MILQLDSKMSIHERTRIRTRTNANLLYPELSYIIQGCIFDIRKNYGPGQKEVVYQRLLKEKLEASKLRVKREKKINIFSHESGKIVGTYQPDILVEDKIILEIKSSRFTNKTDEKQLYYYLRNSEYELGYLINFSTPQLFLKRIIYSNTKKPYLQISVN